jgi:hypothetical protein
MCCFHLTRMCVPYLIITDCGKYEVHHWGSFQSHNGDTQLHENESTGTKVALKS